MGLKRKQMIMGQKAYFEQKLQDRLSFLTGKGIEAPKAAKDTLARKWKASIKAMNNRLKLITDNDKITEEMAKIKAERAAAPQKEQKSDKSEKSKKAPEESKGKKMKTEMKDTPSKTPEGGKSKKAADSPEEGKAAKKK